jgi:hypothetical protein
MEISRIFLCFFLCNTSLILGQPDGWKMTDRFYGFRYELTSTSFNENFEQYLQSHADDVGCFGWIQKTKDNKRVGEVRCSKDEGPKFVDWFTSGSKNSSPIKTEIKVYPDTKIRLHFSHFKILDENRDTCFMDPPHQCHEFSNNKFPEEKDEL